ncbi:S-layer homology domain-containing protein [Paenibacillus thiaminolyticus]|uniref:S-layer homology domain-containing protein n=1 Tax=Paenibacillus thiaminolyticus TaxID=49283 RepID=UPI002543EDCB|nr:S-layer homology domain-containing protein [Paenibacillus thiaminolyticus]WII37512.1 S-layer homology domain-containing protein [Paenibacillus thiaminolyticus]
MQFANSNGTLYQGDNTVGYDDGTGYAIYHSNYYLTTYNNTAFIQTGHTTNASIPTAERNIIANTVFFLAQLTYDTKLNDRAATDEAAPDAPTATYHSTNGSAQYNTLISAKDNGTTYQGYVEAINQNPEITERKKSNIFTETVTSGTKGYLVYKSTTPNDDPLTYADFDENNKPILEAQYLHDDDIDGLVYTLSNSDTGYLHVRAVDWAGNVGPVSHINISDIRPEFTISIVGKVQGAPDTQASLYTIPMQVRVTDAAFDFPAITVPGYKLVDPVNGMIHIDPATASDNQEYVFWYADNKTTVTIKAMYAGTTTPIETFTEYKAGAEIGKPFSHDPPVISGFDYEGAENNSSTPDGNSIASVKENGASEIIFYYTKQTAEKGLILNIVDTDNNPLGTVYRSIMKGEPQDMTYPNDPKSVEGLAVLENYNYKSVDPEKVTYNGVNDVNVTYTYERIKRTVIAAAYDQATGAKIADIRSEELAVGDTHPIQAPPSLTNNGVDYSIISDTTQDIYVSNGAAAVEVKFYYKATTEGTVHVVAWYDADGTGTYDPGADQVIQSYDLTGTVGSPLSIPAPSIHGWLLAEGEADSVTRTVTVNAQTVYFKYDKNVWTVEVQLIDSSTDAEITALGALSYEVPKGDPFTVYAPNVPGYTLTTGTVNTNPTTYPAVDENKTVTFYYTPLEEVVPEYTVTITVIGQSATEELYKYELTRPKNSGVMNVDAFEVKGYKLMSASPASVTVGEDNETVTFEYETLATAVTIRMVDGSGAEIAPSFHVAATTGESFSYNAPYVSGYNLEGAVTQTISSVNSANNSLTFTYSQASGNVTVVLKEGSRIITTMSETFAVNETREIPVPDLTADAYTAVSTAETVTYTGTALTVEYEYTKDTVDIPVKATDYLTGAELDTSTVTGQRKGEAVTVGAPDVTDYVLVGSPTRIVIAGSGEVIFQYRTLAEDEVAVKAMSEDGVLLQSYVMSGTVGETVTATAPDILGWKLTTAATQEATVGTDKEIIFRYAKDVVTVTVKAEDAQGATLDEQSFQAPRGGSFTAYAPHVSGYVLDDDQIKELSNITADASVTFRYKSIEEVVPEHTVTITVIGQSATEELYKYELTRPKNSGVLNVDAFAVKGYKLMSSSPASVTVGEDNETVTFEYETLATAVTIRMVDGSGTEIAPSFHVAATTGESFSYNAPYVSGYNLEGAVTQTIADVNSANNSLTFTYSQASGNVTVVLKEGSRIIKTMSETFAVNETREIPVPDLTADAYTAVSTAETVTYTGTALTVEYEYTKDTVDIPVKATDYLTGKELKTSTVTGQRKGEAVTVGAPDLTDYVLVGSPTRIVIAGSGEVIFQYRTLAEDEVAVKAMSEDGAVLQSYVMSGTVGETVSATAPDILGWKLTTAATQEATVGTDKELIFRYAKDVVTVTVKAEDAQGATLDEQSFQAPRGGSFTAYAPHVSGYVLDDGQTKELSNITADASVTFRYKSIEEVVPEHTVTITVIGQSAAEELYKYELTRPKNSGVLNVDAFAVKGYKLMSSSPASVTVGEDNETVTFEYETLATAVTIRMVDGSGTEIAPSFHVAATTGESFSYNAPYVSGYNLEGAVTQTISSVSSANNSLTFTYSQASGNVTVVLKEGSRIITTMSETFAVNETREIPVPDLTADAYTAVSTAETVTYTGTALTVEYEYTKDTVDIPVKATDYLTGAELDTSTVTGQRKGEAVTVGAPDVTDYVLVGSPTRIVIAGSGEVIFQYRTLAEDEVAVKAMSEDGAVLQSYVMSGTVGETVTATAPDILGWKLTTAATQEATVGTDKEIIFRYAKDVVTVTVKAADAQGATLDEQSFQAPRGGSFTAYAPHVSGYVLDDDQIKELSNITADASVTFRYKSIEEVVPEHTVTITVIGQSAAEELYKYELTRPKNSGVLNVDAFEVKGYKLMSASPASVTVGEDNETVTFEYETLATAVTIRMVDGSGTEIAPSFHVAATTGESFSYNAPYVSGYNLEGAVTQTIASVNSANNSLTFTYSQASGNVTVVLKEGSRIIKTMSETFAVNETREIPVPDLTADAYTAVSTAETVTYTGTALTVEYEYTKDTVDIPVKAVDYLTGKELKTSTVTGQRKGEAVTVGAPDVTDYVLVGSPTRIVIAGSGEVIFQYRTLAEDEVAVKAMSEDGVLLQSYVMSGTVGETVSATAPDILGWKLTTAATQEATVGTDKEIIFRYAKDVVTVTVKAEDAQGATLDEQSFQAPRGGSFTAHAPHVSGYVLDDDQTKELSNITADASVTFRYKSIGEDRIVFVHYVDRANDELLKESIPYVGKVGSELTLTAEDIVKTDKVYKPESYTFNYVITDDFNQQHTFFYNEDEGETYMVTVHYVDQESNKALQAPSTFTGKAGEVLWLRADQITVTDAVYSEANAAYSVTDVVYTPLKFNHLYTITTAPDQQYTFHYVKGEHGDIQLLTINHLEAGTNDVLRDSEQVKGRPGEEILYRSAPITATGVVYHPEQSSYRYTFSDEPDQELTIQYIKDSSQTERQLTVKYLEQGTGKELAGPTTKSGKPGDKVTLAPISVSGYTPVKSSDTYTFTEDEGQVYIFYYTKDSSNPDSGSGGGTGGSTSTETPTDPLPPVTPLPPAPPKLETEHHYSYINGYPDGTIKPENLISREEVAAIFYRLMDDESRANYLTDKNAFSDVASSRWSNKHISTMEHAGIITGYQDGTFKPGRSITRAEFAAIASRFDKLNEQANDMFSDIAGHWAEKYIVSAANKGWIKGYPDGTFKPNQYITRAEAMAFINSMLNRKVKADHIHEDAKQWPDNKPGKWYYADVLEATNHHEYTRNEDGYEVWTTINPAPIHP